MNLNSYPAAGLLMAQQMKCYIPGGRESEPFQYNPALNARPKYTHDYQGPDYKTGGVQLGHISVFMGVQPTTQAAEYYASNKRNSASLTWAEHTEAHLKGKLLGCDVDKWSEETRIVEGKEEKVCVSHFNVPQGNLPAKYCGDLKNWEFGPTTDPLNLDFSNGIHGEVGMITVGNNKGGGVPNLTRNNWNDNVMVVWDEILGKYVCQLDTYMIYNGVKEGWAFKNTGGLITTYMYASGCYEVRAKVPKAPGMVWAIWTFWGNEIWSNRRLGRAKDCASSTDFIPTNTDSPMWIDRSTELGQLLAKPGKEYPNHEIDIEIPSNAPQTVPPWVSSRTPGKDDKYDTMNINCYRWTNNDGTGAYNNLFCHNKSVPFIGDGKYHTYRYDWHTGSADSAPRVDFYFDGGYIGTNDAFVPYMAGRLWIMLSAASNGHKGGNGAWNGVVNQNFQKPSQIGDVARYARVLVDYVRITPFKEPNDHYAPSAFDQPCMGTQPGCVNCGRHNPDGSTSILPYTTDRATGRGGIKWVKKD